jgi:mono/diheme cytochrome c family protein
MRIPVARLSILDMAFKVSAVRAVTLGRVVLAILAGVILTSAAQAPSGAVERGAYLVNGGGCGDCHTPLKMGASGPEPDLSRMLSGHPEKLAITQAPQPPAGPWMGAFAVTMTAWAGPWGVSFTANLTPDKETGLGKWTAQDLIKAIRAGRHMGKGRMLLPPMPYQAFRNFTDDDLKAIFAYLQTIPVLSNRIPEPLPPLTPPAR